MKKLQIAFLLLFFISIASTLQAADLFSIPADTIQSPPYKLLEKPQIIEEVVFKKSKSKKNEDLLNIKIGVESAEMRNESSFGMPGATKTESSKGSNGPLFDNVEIFKGGYDKISVVRVNSTQNLYTLKNVKYPLSLGLHVGKDFIKFEINEPGIWDVNIKYKK